MRNLWRVLAFDVAAPLATVAGLLAIGVVLGWPMWWVSACSVLVLLVVEAVAVNAALLRRDSVTAGTDDDGPRLRLAVVAVATAALVAAVLVGYVRWTEPDRDFTRDSTEVVQVASATAEATATFSPQDPSAAVDKAVAMMVPERAEAFRDEVAKSAADLARDNVTGRRRPCQPAWRRSGRRWPAWRCCCGSRKTPRVSPPTGPRSHSGWG
jgi:hypothetical protein